MKITLVTTPALRAKTDVLVLPVPAGDPLASAEVKALDGALGGRLRRELERARFRGAQDERFLFQTHGELPSRHLIFFGYGTRPELPLWYRIADTAARVVREVAGETLAVLFARHASASAIEAFCEGLGLARYEFNRFRSRPGKPRPLAVSLFVPRATAELRRAIAAGGSIAEATCFTRDLVNTPAGDLPPRRLADEARRLAGRGVKVKIFDQGGISRLGMGALLGVARGSAEEPRFIELVYRPAGAVRRRIALVGKGITFDSGGLSLKTADGMRWQKRDMAGGAIVLGVFKALAALRPPVEVRGYIAATENMPGGRAVKPGDVLRTFGGKTVEVLNTDAEGRLVLADALGYATSKRPDLVIDFATLTAAVYIALGSRYAAIMGTDRELIRTFIAAGAGADERLWELPLVSEYRVDLDSTIADIKNTGEGQAGTIIGGLFLREFVGDVPWAHVDFSSTVMTNGHACHPKGASGFGVRTVLRYLMQL